MSITTETAEASIEFVNNENSTTTNNKRMHSSKLKNIAAIITCEIIPPSMLEHKSVMPLSMSKLTISTKIKPEIFPAIKTHRGTGREMTIYTVLESISLESRFAPINKEKAREESESIPNPKSKATFSGTP